MWSEKKTKTPEHGGPLLHGHGLFPEFNRTNAMNTKAPRRKGEILNKQVTFSFQKRTLEKGDMMA